MVEERVSLSLVILIMNSPSSDDFLLTKNNFELCTKNVFKNLINETEFSDVTLACSDDKQIKAHKVILQACSPFFKKIFRKNPHQHPLLYLKGVTHRDLEAILEFMYQGETKINKDHLDSFLTAAQELRVDGLIFPEAAGRDSDDIPNKTLEEAVEKDEEGFPKRMKMEEDYSTEYGIRRDDQDNLEDSLGDYRMPAAPYDYERSEEINRDRENENAGKFKCDMCDVYITHKWNMMRHKVRVHGVPDKKEPRSRHQSHPNSSVEMEEPRDPKVYSCEKCDFTSAHPTSIKRHIASKHEGVRYKCQVCEFTAAQTHDLKRHTMRLHPEEYKGIYHQ